MKIIDSILVIAALFAPKSAYALTNKSKVEAPYLLQTNTAFSKVYFVPNTNATQFHGHVVIDRGESDMTGTEGIAHYIEHLVSWNALPGLEEKSQRDFNAYTTETFTSYYYDSQDTQQVMNFLRSVFNPIELDQEYMTTEADVVRREYSLRVSDNKYALPMDNYREEIYGSNPLSRSVIGNKEEITGLTPEAAIALMEANYKLENASLVLSGNMDIAAATKLVDEYFGDIDAQEVSARNTEPSVSLEGNVQTTELIEGLPNPIAMTNWVFACPEQKSAKYQAIEEQTENLIESSKNGSLTRKLQFDDKSHVNIDVSFSHLPDNKTCTMEIYAEEVVDGIYLSELMNSWLSDAVAHEDEITQILTKNATSIAKRLPKRKPDDIYGEIIWSIEANHSYYSDQDYLASINDVSFEDVEAFLKQITNSREISTIMRKTQ